MTHRNLIVLTVVSLLSLICHVKAPRNRYATLVAQGIDIVAENSLQQVDARVLFEGAMQGMLAGLDTYSRYLPPEQFQPLQEDLDQQFGGVGIIVEKNPETGQLTVMSPSLGSPAQRAGIRAGDIIVSIGQKPADNVSISEAVELIRGRPGTEITLGIQHRGSNEPVEYTLRREIIAVPSVLGDYRDTDGRWVFRLERDAHIGYIRINTFGEQTVAELREALGSIEGRVTSLIIDLRNNAGGLLSAAVEVSDMFLSDGVVVTTRGRSNKVRDVYYAQPGTLIGPDLPMAVVVNRYSASASEIVAACLQDHGRAIIVGERTWGKGTVQNIYPFEAGRSAIKLTIANYIRPSGANIHRQEGSDEEDQWGVQPNRGFEVRLEEDQFIKVFQQRSRRDVLGDLTMDVDSATGSSTSNGESSGGETSSVETSGSETTGSISSSSESDSEEVVDTQLERAIEAVTSQSNRQS